MTKTIVMLAAAGLATAVQGDVFEYLGGRGTVEAGVIGVPGSTQLVTEEIDLTLANSTGAILDLQASGDPQDQGTIGANLFGEFDPFGFSAMGELIVQALDPIARVELSVDFAVSEDTLANFSGNTEFEAVQGDAQPFGLINVSNGDEFEFEGAFDESILLNAQDEYRLTGILDINAQGAAQGIGELNVRVVPTPGSAALLGLGGFAAARRRR